MSDTRDHGRERVNLVPIVQPLTEKEQKAAHGFHPAALSPKNNDS